MIKTDKVIYRTRTQKEYDWLMRELEDAGCIWIGGSLATERQSHWENFLSDTCIVLEDKKLTYADSDSCKSGLDYEVIEVSDLMGTEEETDAQDKTEKEPDAIEELEAIHKQVTSQIGFELKVKVPYLVGYLNSSYDPPQQLKVKIKEIMKEHLKELRKEFEEL